MNDGPKRSHTHCFGRAGNCTSAPEYIWTGPHGGEYGLCAGCCAEWRQQVRGITPLEPARIRSISPDCGQPSCFAGNQL